MSARTLIKLPTSAQPAEVIEVSTLIAHPMETGYRVDAEGRKLGRNILRRFRCELLVPGEPVRTVFSAELHPAIAANPYLAFSLVARRSGQLRFTWEGDEGFSHTETAVLNVA
jgi:sulfur-oxidizing protein SoxZ